MKQFRYVISGRVQGVFFRRNTARKAQELGLFGYVRNLKDGTVEAVVNGQEEMIKELLSFWKSGPGLSKVSKIEAKEEKACFLEKFSVMP